MPVSLARVLFVDDEPDVLHAISRALRKNRARWDMVFAIGGPAGLEEVRRATCDVVITDMRMPVLDGAALIGHVRDHDPTTYRFVLSGFSDITTVIDAMPIAHQFFDKPCDLRLLSAAIDQACRLRPLLAGTREIVERVPATPPRLYHQLAALVARPGIQAGQVVRVIERDPRVKLVELAAELLETEPASIGDAVTRLGITLVPAVALAAHAFEVLAVSPELRQRSIIAARAARDEPEAFTAALLRDVGAALAPDRTPAVTASLVSHWCVPLAIVEAAAFAS